jgi:hypothetical protein
LVGSLKEEREDRGTPEVLDQVISSPVAHVTYVHAKFPPTLIGVFSILHTLHVTTCLLLPVDTN